MLQTEESEDLLFFFFFFKGRFGKFTKKYIYIYKKKKKLLVCNGTSSDLVLHTIRVGNCATVVITYVKTVPTTYGFFYKQAF